jgi:hypothetical protein
VRARSEIGAPRERRYERRPPIGRLGQIGHGHRGPALEAIQAWALVALQLQQFHDVRGVVGCGHRAQLPPRVAQHDAGRVGRQQLHTESRQPIQQIDDVVLVDQVSARVTNAWLINSSRSLCGRLIADIPQAIPSLLHVLGEYQPASHHIPGDVGEQPVVHDRVRPHPRQRLRGALTSSCTDTIPVAWWISARWATA